MRDTWNCEPAYIQVYGNESKFGLVNYLDGKGEKRPEYHLTKSQTLFLVSGYDMVLSDCDILNENYVNLSLPKIGEW